MIRLGVVTGLAAESSILKSLPEAQRAGLRVDCAGADAERAAEAARTLVDSGCAALLSFGVAGGLAPTLRCGDLLVADTIVAPDGQVIAGDAAWRGRLADRFGGRVAVDRRLAGADQAIATPVAKAALHRQTGAAAVDMESHAVAAVAAGAGVPFLAVRVIVDPVDLEVPAWLSVATAPDGTLRPLAVVQGLARRPTDLPALIRLGFRFRKALRMLGSVAVDAGPLFQLLR